jgi:hypothetical protein
MLFTMWKQPRLVVLTAVIAAIYAVSLVPFKILTLVPGITEIRPGAAIPVLCSLLFGPPAAWGAAIGNLVGDIMGGTLTPGSIGGVLGNFLYGLLPWALWRAFTREEPRLRSFKQIALLAFVCLISAAACAVVVGLGLGLLHVLPWNVSIGVTYAITVNNTVMSLVLGGILLAVLYPAVHAMGLTYSQLLPAAVPERDLDDEAPVVQG